MKPSKPRYRTTNWSAYNRSLQARGDVTIWFSPDLAWHSNERPGQAGAPTRYRDQAIQIMLTLKVLFQQGLRQVRGLTCSLVRMMNLAWSVPCYSTVSRRQGKLAVQIPVRRRAEPLHLLVDSTGIKIHGEGEWKVKQHGPEYRRGWRKVHLAVNADTQEGRVELVSGPTMAVQYLYDARANRRAIFAMERENHGWTGQASWYDYDGWGRETVEAGTLRSVTQHGVSRTVIRATDKRDRWDELGPEMALRRVAGQQVMFGAGRQVIDGREGSHGIGVTPAEITYDGSGMRRKTVTDSSGQKTVYQYDGLGRLIESGLERGERSVNRRLYDSLGRSMQEETVQYRADGSVARRMIGFSWYDAEDRVVFQLNRQGGA
ncbi:IS5 family transposase [Chitinimonas lacunae]|uniref:IS5 family transposase n=1 Tax=Chitinimonas lacunae TaxID=1963018 RepID=A0ABV8MLN9_9NEIS